MGSEDEFEQLGFRNGRLVHIEQPNSSPGSDRTDSIVPNEETGFRVEIKPGALEANESLVDAHEEYGTELSFGSRAKAEAYARRLSSETGSLRIQTAAPNDPSEVDGYLLAGYERSISEPASIDGTTWTFDVGANLYGALGETVVKSGSTPPALEYFVTRDLDVESGELRITVTAGDYVSFDRGQNGWLPDCRVDARDGSNGELLERYWCEIKTGNASFERSQLITMQKLAREHRVLKLRVLIDDLPDQYSVRIHEVDPLEE